MFSDLSIYIYCMYHNTYWADALQRLYQALRRDSTERDEVAEENARKRRKVSRRHRVSFFIIVSNFECCSLHI